MLSLSPIMNAMPNASALFYGAVFIDAVFGSEAPLTSSFLLGLLSLQN